jgi:lipid-binding SYLF domain-containing protein
MRLLSRFRVALIALTALIGVSLSSAAVADSGTIRITVIKAGWVIGGSAGSGELFFRGRRYALGIGGLSYGILFGASRTEFYGRVSNIWRPSDVAGVYVAAGAGAAVGRGPNVIVLTNDKGAVLELTGRQVGLIANLDLSGLAISVR